MYQIWKETEISAAHFLRDYGGKCENLHGHNWRVRVYVESHELDRTGMVVDFTELKRIMEEVDGRLDHRELNSVAPFDTVNPTAENIAKWYFDSCSELINNGGVRVSQVRVWETATSCAIFRGGDA